MTEAVRQQLLAEALAHHIAKRADAADAVAQRLYAEAPHDPDVMHLLGVLAKARGLHPAAVEWFNAAAAANPNQPIFQNNLGEAYFADGKVAEAIACFRRAIELNGKYARAMGNLGNCLAAIKQSDAAEKAYQWALKIDPKYTVARCNLAKLYLDFGHFRSAEREYRQVLEINPKHARAWDGLGQTLAALRMHEDSIVAFRKAIAVDPSPVYHSNLLVHLNYDDLTDPEDVAVEHRAWGDQYANPLQPITQHDRAIPERPRVAFLSPDLRFHPVGRFMLPLFRYLDRHALEIVVFSDTREPDATTRTLEGFGDEWIHSTRMSNEEVAQQIVEKQIDIAIDLAGHTSRHRLLALARRPAPIQMSYLGYPNTTGMKAIDYRIGDCLSDPEDKPLFTEILIDLPHCAWCWEFPEDLPAVNPLPALASRHITFGSLNNVRKLSSTTFELWGHVLRAVLDSRLLIKCAGMSDPDERERMRRGFVARDVDPSRIELLDAMPSYADHLATYHKIDIALDTFPYHGTTTTCEALSMGVPVLTLKGETHASQVGVSLLTAAGMPGLIARDEEHFGAIGASLASDLTKLAAMRSHLRDQLARSTLCDAGEFAADFQKLLLDIAAVRRAQE